jgi:hypothetical protein
VLASLVGLVVLIYAYVTPWVVPGWTGISP